MKLTEIYVRTFVPAVGLIALTPYIALATPPAPPFDSAALAILATAKQASGGAAWDKITGWHEHGVHDDVAYETELNFHNYGTIFKNTRRGKTKTRGYNGRVAWDQGTDGRVTISSDPMRLAEARQSAYGSTYAWFFPQRFPASFKYLGAISRGTTSFDVIRIFPPGATPMEIWIDRTSHLVTKLIDRSGPTPVTASMSDFRNIGGLEINFNVTVEDGDPKHTQVAHVRDVSFTPATASKDFDPPGMK
ncbi:MAG: hypothetical protein ACYDD1_14620 [Caulobacteraceae bacterium]